MKNFNVRTLISGVSKAVCALCFCSLLAGDVSAVQRPTEHTLQGTIEAVDSSRHLIKVKVVQADTKEKVQWVGYKMHTRIMNSKGQRLSVEDLKAGEILRVTYRSHWSAQPQANVIVTE